MRSLLFLLLLARGAWGQDLQIAAQDASGSEQMDKDSFRMQRTRGSLLSQQCMKPSLLAVFVGRQGFG
jgi:hypothetical protein